MAVKTIEKSSAEIEGAYAAAECTHHWIIDPPDGPVSNGVCRKCGEVREFVNYFPYSSWDKESGSHSDWNMDFRDEMAYL